MPRTTSRSPRSHLVALAATVATVALLIGGAHVGAVELHPPRQAADARPPVAASFAVVVKDEAGQPVADAMVAAGVVDNVAEAVRDVSFAQTDAEGMARFDRPPQDGIWVVGLKGGLTFTSRKLLDPTGRAPTPLVLMPGQALGGTVVDSAGRPVEGAEVVVDWAIAQGGPDRNPRISPILLEVARVAPVEGTIVARSGADGRFRFDSVPADAGISLIASAPGRASSRTQVASAAAGAKGNSADPVRITLDPAARVVGRVVSRVAGVPVGGRPVQIRGDLKLARPSARAISDEEGRFEIGDLPAGRANVLLNDVAADGPWTATGTQVDLVSGRIAEARIEIIAGTMVIGRVAATNGMPLRNILVSAYGAGNPRANVLPPPLLASTDDAGAYRFRLPPGAVSAMLNGQVPGHSIVGNAGGSVTALIPVGVATFTLPPILLAAEAGLAGRIVDAAGVPLAGAKVVSVTAAGQFRPRGGGAVATTDAAGMFRVESRGIAAGAALAIVVRLEDGREFDAEVVPKPGDASVTIKLPAFGAGGPSGPEQVAGDEVAGVVVDPQGKPIEGALVHPISWVPNFQARSDAAGRFRVKVGDEGKVEVRVTKDGYEPREYLRHPLGQAGWVVVLDDKTYFEGRLLAPDGSPVADAAIRADSGRKQMDGGIMTSCYTDGKSGPDGKYRLYVEPGLYEFQLRVPGKGVLRLARQAIGTDEAVPLDLKLIPGVNFEAKVAHSLTQAPVAGYRLEDWRNPTMNGTSDAAGVVRIADMLPGPFEFSKVHTDEDYARWWSDAGATVWSRPEADDGTKFRRNLDGLDFDLRPGMAPVTIAVEPAVTIRGRVLDPDGKPVAGATVAPALTGSGNSLTGDTRFSVATGADGTYTMKLPASGKIEYNLVAHDGKYGETRTWANGVIDPFKTTPGQVMEGVTLTLTRGATVVGRVVDAATGVPIPGREVRASAVDKRENRYYDPSTKTEADGTFVLRNIRPGGQFIQAAPFWLNAADAPAGTSLTATLAPDETVGGVELKSSLRER